MPENPQASKPSLTPEKKSEIYGIIWARMSQEDTPPKEVIKKEFGGDENKYLAIMAEWHQID